MRRVDVDERRRRLARRHALAARAGSVPELTEAVVALHATDPASVYLSALARLAQPSLAAIDVALHHDRSLVRVLAMRRTLFVVPVRYLAAVEISSARAVAANERRKLEGYLRQSGITDPPGWLVEAAAEVDAALADADGDGLSARQITARVPRLGAKLTLGAGSKYEVTTGATSRVLGVLAAEGRLIRGLTSGGWTTRRYQWHRRHDWLGTQRADDGADPGAASTEMARRWLLAFGPAPLDDLKWWTGWTVRQVRDALSRLEVVEVDLNGETGLVLAGDLEPEPSVGPWAALLPALDPTPMGWKRRHWFVGAHQGPLFDRSGNIGPTVWVDGRIVGGWSQRPDGSVAVGWLEDVGADRRALIEAEAERLEALLGATLVRPAFPTPLQRQLSA